ncbi:MAG: hypothetical protein R2751_08720 [Bacteroidales bacterium]
MRTFFCVLLALVGLLSWNPVLRAQAPVRVSTPRLAFEGEVLVVSYDLEGTRSEQRFFITLEARDASGTPLPVRTLEGDVGEIGEADGPRHIRWDLARDGVFLRGDLQVRVVGRILKRNSRSRDSRSRNQNFRTRNRSHRSYRPLLQATETSRVCRIFRHRTERKSAP